MSFPLAFPSSLSLRHLKTLFPCCLLPVVINAHDHTGHIFYQEQLTQHAGSSVRSPGLALLCSSLHVKVSEQGAQRQFVRFPPLRKKSAVHLAYISVYSLFLKKNFFPLIDWTFSGKPKRLATGNGFLFLLSYNHYNHPLNLMKVGLLRVILCCIIPFQLLPLQLRLETEQLKTVLRMLSGSEVCDKWRNGGKILRKRQHIQPAGKIRDAIRLWQQGPLSFSHFRYLEEE